MMTSTAPYVLRAIHEWLIDNNDIPYILVNTTVSGVNVPEDFIKDNQIVLNISHDATSGLIIGNEEINFSARFSGKYITIIVPINSILSIYGQNSKEGVTFAEMSEAVVTESHKKKPELRLV